MVARAIEEAAGLGERFPELSDLDAFETVAEIIGFRAGAYAGTALERVILRAYDTAAHERDEAAGIEAGRSCREAWGI